ncbi:LysR family transcriptional regulator [Streptomyces sp. NPDC006552]|uniref:LysR family transcriptional regulator n=1 Tax=Streptomyces sp. NPDC006552 TaxID=3157179 RepID=UPI0033A5AA5C
MLERHEIETFLALAEELHFARTAERLRVSPGRVSQTVKALERRVGGTLFERSSRRVVLTPVGRRLRDELLPAYQRIQQAVADARAAFEEISGVLRVDFTAPWCGDLLVRAADLFSRRYPRCQVELQSATYHSPVARLRDGEVELVIAEPPVEDPGVTVGPVLFTERRALVVPASHALADRETVTLEDFAAIPLVTARQVSPVWRAAHFPRRTPAGRPIEQGPAASDWEGVLSLVGAGRGATVAALRAARYHHRPDVAYVPFSDAPPVEYALMWREQDMRPGLQALIRATVELAPPRPGPPT